MHKSAGAGYALHDRVEWVAQENCVFLNYTADANLVVDKIGDLTKLDVLV